MVDMDFFSVLPTIGGSRKAFRLWGGTFFLLCFFVVVSFYWIDRPLSLFLFHVCNLRAFLLQIHADIPFMMYLVLVAIAVAALFAFIHGTLPKCIVASVLAGGALMVSAGLVAYLLKPMFGRMLPAAFLDTGSYGFYWFRTGVPYNSFPSGHSAQAAAAITVLWAYYPQLRWLYVLSFGALSFFLLTGQYHFLGDIIGGAGVGMAVGGLLLLWTRMAK